MPPVDTNPERSVAAPQDVSNPPPRSIVAPPPAYRPSFVSFYQKGNHAPAWIDVFNVTGLAADTDQPGFTFIHLCGGQTIRVDMDADRVMQTIARKRAGILANPILEVVPAIQTPSIISESIEP